ncbi:hypothetical protein HW555_009563 [Spodoptera exigua]|uniref:Uncharacterized protein n=1 Tax=Spodoptera exigua TaxID=7107 RepID=A0A835L6M5_SPOEX|nr:hypothetical protein HW555_009563 [Spodoptera exigua]
MVGVVRAVVSTLVVEEELGEGRHAHEVVQHAAGVGVERGVVVRGARHQRAAALAPRRLQVLPGPATHTIMYHINNDAHCSVQPVWWTGEIKSLKMRHSRYRY